MDCYYYTHDNIEGKGWLRLFTFYNSALDKKVPFPLDRHTPIAYSVPRVDSRNIRVHPAHHQAHAR